MTLAVDALNFEKGGGVVTVVAQDDRTGAVLMVAFADREAMERTLATGQVHFRSRTRGLWKKGETSGHTLEVVELHADCDADTVLARVRPMGPTCHLGAETCFGGARAPVLARLDATIAERAASPGGPGGRSYTRRLLDDRNLRLKKLGEESAELVTALADGDRARAAEEAADVLYHVLAALRPLDLDLRAVAEALMKREA